MSTRSENVFAFIDVSWTLVVDIPFVIRKKGPAENLI